MNNKDTNTIQKYELNKDDLANVYGRLKMADYYTSLTIKDCYEYIREVVLKRLGIPDDWAIVHSPDWKEITVVGPDQSTKYKDAVRREEKETGKVSQP